MARFPQTQAAAPLQRARLPQVSFGRGAGEGLAELGKGVATLGATLYDRTVQAKQERDAVKATNSFTAFSDSLGQSFIDRLSRKGANAFGVYEEYKTFYDNAAKKAAEQLENDDQVLFFAEKSAALRKSQLSRLQTLEAGAQQEAKSNSIGALRTITEKNANENVFDDASRELLLATYIKGYREQYPGQNVEEDINENVKDIRQNFLRMMIAQDPYKAKAYNTEWKSIIGGANYAQNKNRIKTAINFNDNLLKQRRAELDKEAINKINNDLFQFEKSGDYTGRYNYIANISDQFGAIKRKELDKLERDLKESTRKAKEPRWNAQENELIDRMNFEPDTVSLADIRRVGANTTNRQRLKKIWDSTRKPTITRKDAFKKLDQLWFGSKDIEGNIRTGKFIEEEEKAEPSWWRFWAPSGFTEEKKQALRTLQADQRDRLMDFFTKNPDATAEEVNKFFDTAIRPELAETIVDIAVTETGEPLEVEAESSLRRQAIEQIKAQNEKRIKTGELPFALTERNIKTIMNRLR